MKLLRFAIAVFCINCFADTEPLTSQDFETIARLYNLGLRPSLSQGEIAFVTNSLTSPMHTIAEEALLVIAVHEIPVPLNDKITSEHVIAEIIANGRAQKQSVASFLKKNSYKRIITHFTIYSIADDRLGSDYDVINERLGNIAAVLFTREIRQGKSVKFNKDEYSFSEYDELLLEYAEHPASEIPKMIIPALANVTLLTTYEYNLVRVLATYDDINLDLILSTLKSNDTSKYGKIILFDALLGKVGNLENADREKIRTTLQDNKYDDDDVEYRLERLKLRLRQAETPKEQAPEEPANGKVEPASAKQTLKASKVKEKGEWDW